MQIHAYRRKEPITVDLLGQTIQFKLNDIAHCVADVVHEGAALRLLSIPEAYTAYGDAADSTAVVAATSAAPAEPVVPTLLGSDQFPEEIEIAEDRFLVLADVVDQAYERSGLNLASWNLQTDGERQVLIQQEIDTIKAGMTRTDEDDEAANERERQETAQTFAAAQAAAAAVENATVSAVPANGTEVAEPTGEVKDPLVLVNEAGETLDLNKFTAKQVRAFAEEHDITLPGGNSTPVADLRLLLAQALQAPKSE